MRLLWVHIVIAIIAPIARAQEQRPWSRHIIDNALKGADGVRLVDVNGDGKLDVATGWEEGGGIRVCINPGAAKVKAKWPAVTVGKVGSPEDAVLVDVDGDGNVDVVSSCEGRTRAIYFHLSPGREKILDEAAWTTARLPASE